MRWSDLLRMSAGSLKRRKLRAFKAKVDAGEMTVKQVREWLTSQIAYFENYNDHGRVLKLNRLFHAIYGGVDHA